MKREHFDNRFMVVAALAGSAIGLGNIWRFPYTVGTGGGAAFIIIYIISMLVISLPIMLAEGLIGKTSQRGAFGAFKTLAPGSPWKWVALLTVFSPLILLSYYSVVGGWSFGFFLKSLTLDFTSNTGNVTGIFGEFISTPWKALLCHSFFIWATGFIVFAGVKDGIGKFSSTVIPVLFLMIVAMAIYSICLPGGMEGVSFLFKPDFSKIDGKVFMDAVGQSFFSLSLGVGTILTYSSYMKKSESLMTVSTITIASDFCFAMIAGLAIFPAVFSAGIEPGTGPGLVFETIPYIFNSLSLNSPVISSILTVVFFFSLLIAALSSSISMLEVGVSYLSEEKGMERRNAVLLLTCIIWLLGCGCCLSFGPLSEFKLFGFSIFDAFDKLVSNILMPLGGILFTIFAGRKISKSIVFEELTGEANIRSWLKAFMVYAYFGIRYLAPAALTVIFLYNLLG